MYTLKIAGQDLFGLCTEILLLEVGGPVVLATLDYCKLRHQAAGKRGKERLFKIMDKESGVRKRQTLVMVVTNV